MTPESRWIVVSGISSEASSATWTFDLAAELSLRHPVLFWDMTCALIHSGKTMADLLPYQKVFSSSLLRNFLSYEGTTLSVLQGTRDLDWPRFEGLIALIKESFTFIIVAAPPTWKEDYLRVLDSAHLLLLITPGDASLSETHRHIDELAKHKFPKALAHTLPHSEKVRGLAKRLETDTTLYTLPQHMTRDATQQAKSRIHERLLESTSSQNVPPTEKTHILVERLIAEETALPSSREARGQLFSDLMHDVLGLGPLEPLLQDPDVTEIMVNGPQTVFVEKKGRLYPTGVHFENENQLRTVIDRIVAPIGRRVDESSPLCDARLGDGSRVNIVLPPLALDGPTLTIRKFSQKRLNLDELIQNGALTRAMGDFLIQCVQARKNIVVSGGTGSGKTTLLNILSGFISPDERIATIEDAAELKLRQPHVVRLESRPANAEGHGAISIRRLVMNALRMRPDRIVVGECRGGEALDMLQAMNTGHDGSLTTLHANSPRDALGRLEALVLMAGIDLPIRVVREQIRSAVHLIIQINRLADGSRKITSITELTGMEGDVLTTAELFRYRANTFETTGLVSQGVRS